MNRFALRPLAAHFPLMACLLTPGTLLANPTPEPEARALLDITVTASPLGRTSDELVQPALVLSGEALEQRRRNTIGDTLSQELGVSTTDFGTGAGRPVIRGQSGPRVEVLSNGIATLDAAALSPDHAVAVNPLIARQIEVLKGPATLLFGGGAIGGVVNVVNNRLPTEVTPGFRGQIEASGGDVARDNQVFGDFNIGAGAHQFHADFSRNRADDYRIPGFADLDGDAEAGVGRLKNSFNRTEDNALSYTFVSDAGHSAGIAVSRYESRYGLPGHDHGEKAEGKPFIDLRQNRVDTQVTLRDPLNGFESLQFKVSRADYEHVEFEAPGVPGTTFTNDETQGRVEAVHDAIAGWRGVLGLQVGHRNFKATGEEAFINQGERVQTQSTGIFVVEERATDFGKLEAGLRVDRVQHDPRGGQARRRDVAAFSGSVGSVINLGPETHLAVSAGHAERAPAIEELYASGEHAATRTFERGNANLRKERAQTVDIGLDHHIGRVDITANVFYKQVQDYIFFNVSPEGFTPDIIDEAAEEDLLLGSFNQRDARFRGAELAFNIALIETGDFRLGSRVFGDTVRGEFTGQGGPVPRMTPNRFGASLHSHYRSVAANLEYTRVSTQDRLARDGNGAAVETVTAGHDLLQADLTWQLPSAWTGRQKTAFFVRGSNLLNEDVRRATSFVKDFAPAPGRALSAGVRVAF